QIVGCNLLSEPAVGAVVCSFRDVTDRKRSEQLFRYVTRHARCLLWHGIVWEGEGRPTRYSWQIEVPEEISPQGFLPLELRDGESYADAWVRARQAEGPPLIDRNSAAALTRGRDRFTQEFRCRGRDGAL